ncbi:hypothetical protein B5F18_05870 [Lachnoclostridium sp. An181]|nr:hypothetical protein B5F18_05870 [Lachnoclostridium sp. An181]
MKKSYFMILTALIFLLSSCGVSHPEQQESHLRAEPLSKAKASEKTKGNEEMETKKIKVQIDNFIFTATLENNTATKELIDLLEEEPITIEMTDYAGMEKVGPLGATLTATNEPTTTHSGDIVLYNGDHIVLFYGTNSWSYTRLGKIDDLSNWKEALGTKDITIVLSLSD